jgi:hypothetical protein
MTMLRIILMVALMGWTDSALARDLKFESTSPAATRPSDADVMVDLSKTTPVTVLSVDQPGIKKSSYSVIGEVKYEDVKGEGYLELWSTFPDGARYFTRTLGTQGAMKKLDGSSGWRWFELPFKSKDGYYPTRLEVNVVGTGGKVWLRNGKMAEGIATWSAADPNAWWGERQGGLLGGIFGSSLGVAGGIVGLLAARGRGRNAVMALIGTMIIMGIMLVMTGLFALLMGQGWPVYYPLLLCGVISTVVAGGMLPVIRRKYAEIELRKVGAMDAG